MVACKLLLLPLVDASLDLLEAHEEFFSLLFFLWPGLSRALQPSELGVQTMASRHEFWRLGSLVWLGPWWREAAGFETPGLFEVLQQGFVFSAVDTPGSHAGTKGKFVGI